MIFGNDAFRTSQQTSKKRLGTSCVDLSISELGGEGGIIRDSVQWGLDVENQTEDEVCSPSEDASLICLDYELLRADLQVKEGSMGFLAGIGIYRIPSFSASICQSLNSSFSLGGSK